MKRFIILGVVGLVTLLGVTWYVVMNRKSADEPKAEARLTAPATETKPATLEPSPAAKAPETVPAKSAATKKHGKRRGGKTAKRGGKATTGTSSGLTTTQTAPGAGDTSFDGALAVGQLGAFGEGTRSFTEIAAEIGYRFGKNRVAIVQEARKMYLIAPQGENEVLVADTVLTHERELSPDVLSFQVKSLIGLTLPVSSESRRVKHVTRPSVGFTASRDFFGGALSVEYTPTFSYFFNSYATSPEHVPLRRMALGQQGEIALNFFKRRLRWAGWAKHFLSAYQQYDDSTSSPSPTGSLEVGTYVDYRISKNVAAQVGYVHGSSMLRHALVDAPFYDPHASRVYGAVTVSF